MRELSLKSRYLYGHLYLNLSTQSGITKCISEKNHILYLKTDAILKNKVYEGSFLCKKLHQPANTV